MKLTDQDIENYVANAMMYFNWSTYSGSTNTGTLTVSSFQSLDNISALQFLISLTRSLNRSSDSADVQASKRNILCQFLKIV